MKTTLRPLLFCVLALGAAACSGKTSDVYVGGGGSGSGSGDQSGFTDDTAQSCTSPLAPQTVCSLQLSGTAAEQTRTLTALDAVAELGSDVRDLVSEVHKACAAAIFFLGGSSAQDLIISPTATDARNACAELRDILVARGPVSVTDTDPTCTDVPRATCAGVTLPPRRVCAAPALHVTVTGLDTQILQKYLAAIFAAEGELKALPVLVSVTTKDSSALASAPTACVPGAIATASGSSGDVNAIAAAITSVVGAVQ